MKRKAKRLLSLLLAFTLVLQSLPASVLTVNASRATETVPVTTVPSGVGTAAAEAGEDEYYFEASVNEACDASINGTGYKFWKFTYAYGSGDIEESKDNPMTLLKSYKDDELKVDGVKALFSYVYKDTSRVINVRINGDGQVSLKKENDTYKFTAEPAEGYRFVNLAVPEGVTKTAESKNAAEFTVDSTEIADNKDFVITANFEAGYGLTVDGELVGPSNADGTGWEYKSDNNTLLLDEYNGGSIVYSGEAGFTVKFKGENKVTGEISAANALTLAGEEDGAKLTASLIKAEKVTFNSGKVNVLSENGCAITGVVNVKSGVTLTAETKLKNKNAKAIDGSVNNAIKGKGTTSDNKTYSIAATDGAAKGLEHNFVKVEFATHIHAFRYNVEDGTVTADCSANETTCDITGRKVTLTIKAPAHKTYGDGLSANATLEGLDEFNAATGLDIKKSSIEYYSDASVNKLSAAPTDAGKYYAKITVSGTGIAGTLDASIDYVIEGKNITVKAKDAEKIYGDADPKFGYEVTGLVSGDKAEMIKVTSMGRREGENAGTYAIIPRGKFEQGNYKVSYSSGTLTINRAPVTVSACDASKKFGEDDPEFTWTASGIKNGENAEKLLEVDLTRDPGEGVGTYDIVASGAKNQGNYVVSYKKAKFTISENDALFTAPKAIEGLSFNGAAQELVVSGNVSEEIGVLQYTVSDNKDEEPKEGWSTDVPKATDAGTYYVWYRIDSENPNYKSAEAKYIEASINKAVVTVYAVDASKTYGDKDPAAFSAAVVGLKNKDTITYSLTRKEGEDAGSYEIGFGDSEIEQGNYVIDYVPAEFTILPAKVTVTAEDKTVSYGDAEKELTWKVTGLKNNEQKSVLTVAVSRAEGTDAGVYAITPSGEEIQGNYAVKYVDGKYTIEPAKAVITVLSANKTYGEEDPEFKWEVTGLKNSDTEAVIKDAVTIIREPGEDVGEYAILASCDDKKAGNYSLTVGKTAKLTIEKKVVKVTGGIRAKAKYYDGTTAAELNTTYATVEGAVYGDNIGVTATGEFVDANASSEIRILSNDRISRISGSTKTVNIKNIKLTGEKAGNYSLSSNGNQTETSAYLGKKELIVKAVANSKVFGTTDPEFTYTCEGIVSADKAEDGTVSKNVITGELARVIGEDVDEYDILQGTLAAANYYINYTGAKFTILPNNEIKPTVSVQGWIYGSFDAETNAPQVTGNFGEGHETYFYKAEGAYVWTEWNDETVAKLPAGKYNVSANVAATTSYNAAYTEEVGSFTVEQRQIGLAWSNTALTYNGKAQKPEATAIGTVFDDAIAVTVTGEKTNAGSYVAEATGLTGATAASYKLLPPATAFFTIGKAAATITINDKNKIYGAADPEFTADTVVPVENEVLNYTISREAGEDAGTYDIRVTLGENPNYDVEIVKAKLTINKAASAVTKVPVANTLVANGKSQALIAEGATEDGVMIYAVTDTDAAPEAAAYKTAIPTATNAGNYYVWFKVRGDANHNDSVPENIKVTIDKPATIAVRPYAKTDLTENGTEQELVTEGSASNGKLMYALGGTTSPASGWSTAVPKAKDAGTYYVWYYAAAENGRKDTIESCVVVAIAEAENAAEASANKIVSATAAKTGLVDNGEEQALIAVPAEELPEGYTMMYALGTDTVNVPETGWSTSIPVAKDAGVYYVWCYAAGEGDLNDTYAVCVTVIVEEKSAKVKAEEAKQANFAAVGDTAAIVPDASGKVWTLDASANDASSNEVTLKLTLTAGAKITLVGYDKKLSKQFKQFNKLSKKTATISTKGVLKAKKAGSGTLKYALAGGRVVTLDYTVVTPAVTVEKGSNISVSANAPGDAKKLNATYTAAGKFDVKLTGVPLNAVYTFSGNKVLNKDNIVIGSDGQIHITGEIAAKDKAKVVIYAQGKKLTVKITGKFK